MYELTKQEQRILKDICKFYGCKLKFKAGFEGGVWDGDTIIMDTKSYTFSGSLSTFFHELGHYMNWQTGKYPLYHNPKLFGKLPKLFSSYPKYVRYSLNAEIATEKMGSKLMKEWFPKLKYQVYYKNTNSCYQFLFGYYLKG